LAVSALKLICRISAAPPALPPDSFHRLLNLAPLDFEQRAP
jgi:hypothetical protein